MVVVLAEASGSGLNLLQIMLHTHWVSQVVLILLVLCSILSIAVMVERWIVLNNVRRSMLEGQAMLDNWAATRDWESARTRVVQSTRDASPLLSLLRSGVVYWQELTAVGETRVEVMELMVKEAVERELKLIASMMRANLPILANIASVAPFIGLFGTVIGIILTFDHIQRTGNLGIELVASGIADALVATALGLFAAIPAVLAYNVFTSKINVLLLQMEETAMERIYFLVQRKDSQTSNAGR